MAIRVIQWATGGVGRAAVAGVIAHPDLELVGCWVHNADKVGGDVGELCGVGPLGIEATDDIDELLGLDADCVIYSPFMADPRVVRRILTSGTNVVTPLNWFYPGGRDESRIEAACAEGGATIHGTGIHPGGITERFPLMVSALSQSITHVRAEEYSDIRSYGAPGVVGDIMLFGKTPEEVKAEGTPDWLVPHRVFEGDRPSNTLLLEELTPAALGKLVALYEHSVFTQGVIWQIDSFDQWGVELGKVLAKKIVGELEGSGPAAGSHDSSTTTLIERYRRERGSADSKG